MEARLFLIFRDFVYKLVELKDPEKYTRYSLDFLFFNKNYYNYCPIFGNIY